MKIPQVDKIYIVEPQGASGVCHYTYNLCETLSQIGKNIILITNFSYELKNLPRSFKIRSLIFRFSAEKKGFILLRKSISFLKHYWNFLVLTFYIILQGKCCLHYQWYLPKFFILHLILIKPFVKKIIYTAHNVLPHYEGFRQIEFFREIYGKVDIIIVHAKESQNRLYENFPEYEGKAVVIPHGTYSFFNRGKTLRIKFPEEKVILFFGGPNKHKGLDVLLRAFNKLILINREIRLLVVGYIENKKENFPYYLNILNLEARKRTTFIIKYVDFEEVEKYFKSCSIVVLPYTEASQSGVLQIAYGFGKPVVASRVGGLPEVVEHRKSGLLVTPGDENELADSLNEIFNDPVRLKSMGEYARHLSVTRYNWKDIAIKTFKIYSRD